MELKRLIGRITANGQQLLKPLSALLALLYFMTFIIVAYYAIQLVDRIHDNNVKRDLTEFTDFYSNQISAQIALQELVLFGLDQNPDIRQVFASDSDFTRFDYVFDRLKNNNISHLYFISPQRRVLYRAHSPASNGDIIQRATMLSAEANGEVTSGLEFGVHGTVTLRSVLPLYQGNSLLGFVEVGMELGHVARNTERQFNIELIEFFDKNMLDARDDKVLLEVSGRISDTQAHPDYLINHNPQNPLQVRLLEKIITGFDPDNISQQYAGSFAITTEPVRDFSDTLVGYISFVHDITSLENERDNMLTTAIVIVALLAIVAIVVFSYVLRYVEDVVHDYSQQNHSKAVALRRSLHKLESTQAKMVEREKFASLGTMVAGVAHEMSTPMGNSLTAASSLKDEVVKLEKHIATGKISKSEMNRFVTSTSELSELVERNLLRSAGLLQSFKQVAVDQSSSESRNTNIKELLNEIVLSMKPQLKKSGHAVNIHCDNDLNIKTVPGYWTQIIINLISNSLTHGFENTSDGKINISVSMDDDAMQLDYQDNGKGIDPITQDKVFEPFFTTKRDSGGSGLGLHLVYNMVSQGLKGAIQLAESSKGANFVIRVPRQQLS